MIHTAKQLKDKVKNMSGGNSEVAQALIRGMLQDGYGGDESFPHDGKQGRCGCGEGYSWDDNDGGYAGGSHKGSSGGGNGTGLLIFAICLAAAVGVFNEN